MSFFIPEGAQWNALARDATKQRALAGASLAAGLTGLSRMAYAYGPRFKRRRLNPRKGRKFNRGLSRLRRKKRGTSGRGLTFEHDRQAIYKKRSMPYRKKRRWKAFTRKVAAVAEKEMGTRMVLFNKSLQFENSTNTLQGVFGLTLYGLQSTNSNETWYNDLNYMGNLENDGNPTAIAGDRVADNAKMMFQSAVLDITLRNVSTSDGALDPECTLETDVYELSMRKDAELGGTPYGEIKSLMNGATTQGIYDQNATAQGFRISVDQRGCTPFETNKVMSQYGLKIWKKTKFFLRNGQTLTYQVRDPRRHVAYRNKIVQTLQGFNKPGWTKIILIIYKSVPGLTIGTQAGDTQEKIHVGITRKYMYKVEGLSEDRSIRVVR